MNIVIPHAKQTNETSCGAAALSMIYSYYRIPDQDEATIWNRLKERRNLDPNQEFIRTDKLAKDVVNFGLHYVKGKAIWEDKEKALKLLEEFIKIKVPVIVCQKFKDDQPFGHFRVVAGLTKKYVRMNDPYLDHPSRIKKEEFIDLWQKTSEEVTGGEFVAILDDNKARKLGGITVYYFNADIDYFQAANLHFINSS